jgi:hypothetical protein
MAELMLLRMPLCNVFQVTPVLREINPATAADKMSTTWFDPSSEASPKMVTFILSKAMRNVIGINASTRVGFLVFSPIKMIIVKNEVSKIRKYNEIAVSRQKGGSWRLCHMPALGNFR